MKEEKKVPLQAKIRQKMLDQFCYLKVKGDEIEEEKDSLQKKILGWTDRPDKEGVDVPPYGTLKLGTRSNWYVLDVPAVFKKVGKSTFLEICKVTTGKLKEAIGKIGFKKLEKLGIIEQGADTEFLTLKRSKIMKKAVNGGK